LVDRQWASAIPASNAASSVASKACAAASTTNDPCIAEQLEGTTAQLRDLPAGLEVDDARAAVRWLGEQPGIDGARPPPSQP
jgi:hypothetical protein